MAQLWGHHSARQHGSPNGYAGSTFTETTMRMAPPGVVRCATCTTLHGSPGCLLGVRPITNTMLQGRLHRYHTDSEQLSFGNFRNLAKVPGLGIGSAETWELEPGSLTPSHAPAYPQMVLHVSYGGCDSAETIVQGCLFPPVMMN